ncbi:MAG: hypothetical protein Q8P50_15805 [Bacillota bacterium]|nr:hypothetical protein [Bacillota bacterium]
MKKCVNLAESGLRLVAAEVIEESTDRMAMTLEAMRECPHVVALLPSRDVPERRLGLYALPEDKLWWLEMLVDDPSLIKAKSVKVSVLAPGLPEEVWLNIRAAEGKPPCGSECTKCPLYREKCRGCPSSGYFLGV